MHVLYTSIQIHYTKYLTKFQVFRTPQFDHLCSTNTPPAEYDYRVDEMPASKQTSYLLRKLELAPPLEAGLEMYNPLTGKSE